MKTKTPKKITFVKKKSTCNECALKAKKMYRLIDVVRTFIGNNL